MRKRILVVSLWMALGGLPQAWAQANVVADSGFRPKPHGFSFENWGGNQHPHAKLTPDDAAYLFGEQACARKQNDVCVPTPGAKMWIDQMNKATEGGHCEGMAVLSAAFYVKQEKVDDFGARQAFELKPNDEWLMRTISAYFTTQALEPVQSATNATKRWPLQKIVDHLAKTMKSGDDYPTLGIYGAGGGHAVTPYKIDQTGAGKYRIFIYDNNYPGAEKFIDVDVGKNEWIYSGAALNPKEDPAAWKGGAGSMDVTLLSTRYEPLKCPFCGPPVQQKPKPKPKPKPTPASAPKTPGAKAPGSKAPTAKPKAPGSKPKPKPKPKPQATAPKPKPIPKPKAPRPAAAPAQGYTVYTSSRCSQVQAVGKSSKQQIKMGALGADSQIAGASMQPMRGTRGCVVHLPKDQEYDVRLVDDGQPSNKPLNDLTVFGSGKVYQVSDVAIRPDAAQTISFSPTNFNYQAGGKQKPTVRIANTGYGADSYYEVSDFEIDEGHNFTAEEDEYGRVAFSDDDPELDDYDIDVEVVGDDDTEYYEFEDVSTGDNGEVLMEIDEEGEFDMDVDTDGDGEGNYYDEDDDNDGSDDASDDDDDNDGVGDDSDADFVGEDYDDGAYEGEDDGADDGEDGGADDGADDGSDEDEDEGDGADEGEDEGSDDGTDEGEDEGADDGSDEGEYDGSDDGSDEGEDDGADDDGDDKSAMIDDGDDGSDESEDESAEDEASYEDEDEAESEDEAAYDDESESEDEAGYDEDAESEDEAAYEDEAAAEEAYEDDSGEDEAGYEDEAEADEAYEDDSGEDEAGYEDEADAEEAYEDDSGEDEAAYDDE